MKTFEMKLKAGLSETGECIVGSQETGSHACYIIYGTLRPGEKGRLLKPGAGHEEILLAVKGSLDVTGFMTGTVPEGSAVHIAGDQECFIESRGDTEAVYVIAGGHSEGGHH